MCCFMSFLIHVNLKYKYERIKLSSTSLSSRCKTMLGSSLIVASPEHLQHCAKTDLKVGGVGAGGGGGGVYKYLNT